MKIINQLEDKLDVLDLHMLRIKLVRVTLFLSRKHLPTRSYLLEVKVGVNADKTEYLFVDSGNTMCASIAVSWTA